MRRFLDDTSTEVFSNTYIFMIILLGTFSVYASNMPQETSGEKAHERETYICEKNGLIFISFDWADNIFLYTDQANDYYCKGVISNQGDDLQLIIEKNKRNDFFSPKYVRVLDENKLAVTINEKEWDFEKISNQIEIVGDERNYNMSSIKWQDI